MTNYNQGTNMMRLNDKAQRVDLKLATSMVAFVHAANDTLYFLLECFDCKRLSMLSDEVGVVIDESTDNVPGLKLFA